MKQYGYCRISTKKQNIDRQIWKEFLRLQQKLNASYSVLCVANIYQALISTHIMTLTYLEEKRDQLTANITVEKPQKKTKIVRTRL